MFIVSLDYATSDPIELHSLVIGQITMELQIYWKVTDYNHRWSSAAIKNGKKTLAESSHGKDNITAPFCHWNLDGIYEHVENICERV